MPCDGGVSSESGHRRASSRSIKRGHFWYPVRPGHLTRIHPGILHDGGLRGFDSFHDRFFAGNGALDTSALGRLLETEG